MVFSSKNVDFFEKNKFRRIRFRIEGSIRNKKTIPRRGNLNSNDKKKLERI